MLAIGGSLPIGPKGYRVNLEATSPRAVSSERGRLPIRHRHASAPALCCSGLEGPVAKQVRWRAGAGRRSGTSPPTDEGIFLSGGTTRFLAGAGIDYRRPLFSNWDLMASARYDFHRFRTATLEDRGFAQAQAVSRASLSLGLSRRVR